MTKDKHMTFVSSLSKADPLYLTLASSLVIFIVLSFARIGSDAHSFSWDVVLAIVFLAIGRGNGSGAYTDRKFLVLVAGVVLWLASKFTLKFIREEPRSLMTRGSAAYLVSNIIVYPMLVVLTAQKAMTKCPPCE